MKIDKYFDLLESLLSKSKFVADWRLSFMEDPIDQTGLVKGTISFVDDSLLEVTENSEFKEKAIDILKYRYHYQKGTHLIFRYDNKPEKRNKKLETFPDHLHLSDRKAPLESDIPDINLEKVLRKILSTFKENKRRKLGERINKFLTKD